MVIRAHDAARLCGSGARWRVAARWRCCAHCRCLCSSQEQLEDVVVTGIRGSLERIRGDQAQVASSSWIRSASEDLGKFPDSNVAESLQRIPGVSIDRDGGEGRFVTVRGFGPEFNTVLVNGRTFASDNEGREFSFDLLAAELIFGADIYKSAVASVPDGGIGATINIKTPRPLDLGGFEGIVSAKGVYEDLSEEVAPQGFALLSDVFADGKLGLLGCSLLSGAQVAHATSPDNNGYLPRSIVGPTSCTTVHGCVRAPQPGCRVKTRRSASAWDSTGRRSINLQTISR